MLAAPAPVAAWCRTLNAESPRCTLDDYTEEEITANGLVDLEWLRDCVAMSYYPEGAALDQDTVLDVLDRSVTVWNGVRCDGTRQPFSLAITEEFSECAENQVLFGRGNVNTLAWLSEGWQSERGYDRDALAVTLATSTRDSGEILDADMFLNSEYWDWADCPATGCSDEVDLMNTVVHELGHVLGLGHTLADRNATMWASAAIGTVNKRSLAADDVAGLCAIYPTQTVDPECSYAPLGGFDPSCGENEGCYCAAPGATRSTGGTWYAIFLALGGIALLRRRR